MLAKAVHINKLSNSAFVSFLPFSLYQTSCIYTVHNYQLEKAFYLSPLIICPHRDMTFDQSPL